MFIKFKKSGQIFEIHVNDQKSHDLSANDLRMTAERWQTCLYTPDIFGEMLYSHLFQAGTPAAQILDEATRPNNTERILLVLSNDDDQPDKLLERVPWEYLHTGDYFLATRHHILRALPESQRREWHGNADVLHIHALLSDPARTNNRRIWVRRAWHTLRDTADHSGRAVNLERIIPPTLGTLSDRLSADTANLIHLLCHGGVAIGGNGDAILVLQDKLGDEKMVSAAEFIDSVRGRALMVLLNACRSADVGYGEMSNLAYALVRDAVPYALGMQFDMAEYAVLPLATTFYSLLLRGYTIEEAVRQARISILADEARDFKENPHPAAFWAGVPALYTALNAPLPPFKLVEGTPRIIPDPKELQRKQYIESAADSKLIGRGREIVEVSQHLQTIVDNRPRYITLHGLGGVGKTSLAYEVVERNAWAFDWRYYWVSFEQIPTVKDFLLRLAKHYLPQNAYDPDGDKAALQRVVLPKVRDTPSIIVLDNIETLISAAHPEDETPPDAEARQLEAIINNMTGGETVFLLTSRVLTGWKGEKVIDLTGLPDEDGAKMFMSLLEDERRAVTDFEEAKALSQRVRGHPLSIRLLAGQYKSGDSTLADFMAEIDTQLVDAEDKTPASLYDRERQATLFACMDYSVKRLSDELRDALEKLYVFQNPFLPELGQAVLNTEGDRLLRELVARGLLETTTRTYADKGHFEIEPLQLYALHPMLRWYIDWGLNKPDTATWARFAEGIKTLVVRINQNYWGDARLRDLVQVCADDIDAAQAHLTGNSLDSYAYNYGEIFKRRRQFGRAMA
ncbi:MAG: CHAT domain-containing protein, partial [Anaerolineaceae bacterium]